MTDYSELIKALRCCILNSPETCVGCTYNIGNNECNVKRIVVDAAAAIEELSAQLADKDYQIREQWDEIQRLRADVKRQQDKMIELAKKLPKRGEWIYKPKDAIEMMFTLPKCSVCGHESSDANNYCPNCGAKMNDSNASNALKGQR